MLHVCSYLTPGSCPRNLLTGFFPGQNQLTKPPEDHLKQHKREVLGPTKACLSRPPPPPSSSGQPP